MKIKKLFPTFILCTLLLCNCSANGENGISETAVPAASSVIVTTGSSAETVSETDTTATTRAATVTEPAEEEIILTPIPAGEPLEVMNYEVIDSFIQKNEEDFPDKETLKLAKQICFEDEYVQGELEEYNKLVYRDYGEDSDGYVRSADDITAYQYGIYDFDMDGEDESLIFLNYKPLVSFGSVYIIYIDNDGSYDLLAAACNGGEASIIKAGDYVFLKLYTAAGAIAYWDEIYSFESGKPLTPLNTNSNIIGFENGFFYCYIKYTGTVYPFVLCGDGKFRQFGREKITREDFEKHMENGGAYLDSLTEKGYDISEIYTYGYYTYQLCGNDFYYNVSMLRGEVVSDIVHLSEPEEIRFTDEVIYGDVWAIDTTRSQDYDIGGGYVCYISDSNKTLHVVKDNIITDSIKLGANNFRPDWQIHFYDMDVPPCFALSIYGINYQTYFIIDGKITEMNWTLDGERLDTVDYTMLHCRGEGDGFVSYSIPIWEDDHFVKRHFTFADGDYTTIVGYSEEIDGEIIKWWDKDSGTSRETADEIMHKVCGFWSSAYRAEKSYDGNERWLLLIEEEGFRTKEEMMNTLSEFCTPTAAEEYYSMILEGEYPDFEIIDGRIYLHDGPPNNYLPYYYIESAEEKDGVITARFYAYYSGQDIPYRILPPLYAEFVREDGVWKISSLPKEK